MKLKTVWVVKDPGKDSELIDICFDLQIQGGGFAGASQFFSYIRGVGGAGNWERENTTMYTGENEAREDAIRRLQRRDEARRKARFGGAGRGPGRGGPRR